MTPHWDRGSASLLDALLGEDHSATYNDRCGTEDLCRGAGEARMRVSLSAGCEGEDVASEETKLTYRAGSGYTGPVCW